MERANNSVSKLESHLPIIEWGSSVQQQSVMIIKWNDSTFFLLLIKNDYILAAMWFFFGCNLAVIAKSMIEKSMGNQTKLDDI